MEDYREVFSTFVDEEYINLLDDEGLEYSQELSELGRTPKVCVAVGLSQTEDLDWNLEEIAEELEVSRRAIYNSREELDLIEQKSRGLHVD